MDAVADCTHRAAMRHKRVYTHQNARTLALGEEAAAGWHYPI